MMLYVVRCRRAGFTLIEIMIVIAIIAILAGIAIPNMKEAKAEAQLEACRKNILLIADSIHMAMIRYSCRDLVKLASGSPSATGVSGIQVATFLVDYGYLDKVPQCPSGGDGPIYGDYAFSLSSYGMCGITCSAQVNGKYGHVVGNKRIRPFYLEGTQNSGGYEQNGIWQDRIEEI